MDRLGSISAFLKVAEFGSFARAGAEIGVSGSAISKSVSRLEDRFRVRLFNRNTRALSLTDDGRELRDRCAPILAELESAETAMLERASGPAGVLRVGLPEMLGRYKFLPLLDALTKKFPDLRIEASMSNGVVDMVEAGFDVTVRIGEPRDSRLIMKRVGVVRYVVCGSPEYLSSRGIPASPGDLADHDCVQRLPHSCSPAGAWKFSDPQSDEPFEVLTCGSLRFDSAEAALEAALNGSGLAQVHDYMVEEHLKSGRLVRVLAPFIFAGPSICVLYPSSRHLTPKVRAFIDAVSGHFDVARQECRSKLKVLPEIQPDAFLLPSARQRPRLVASY